MYAQFGSCIYTPGNVLRGNQSYANEFLTGASGHELLAIYNVNKSIIKLFTNLKEGELANGQCSSVKFSFLDKSD